MRNLSADERQRRFDRILAIMDDEGDRRAWTDEATGFDCLVLRGPLGALNGYVKLPRNHPWVAMGSYDHIADIRVMGGISFLSDRLGGEEGWHVGFATGHGGDAAYILRGADTPATAHLAGRYFDLGFTQAEVRKLALAAQKAQGC